MKKFLRFIPVFLIVNIIIGGCDKESNTIRTGEYTASKKIGQQSLPTSYQKVNITVKEKIGNNKLEITTDVVTFKCKIGNDKYFKTSSNKFHSIEGSFIGNDSLVITMDGTPSIHDTQFTYYCKKN